MGLAIDTVGLYLTNAATTAETLTAMSASSGDSLSVRNYNPPAYARLEAIFAQGVSKDQFRLTSPMMHDDVTGITLGPVESPAQFLFPTLIGQMLYPSDTLTAKYGAAASSSSVAALLNYYSDLPGASARLHMPGDISGIVKSIKTWEVDATTSATIGTWADTAINTDDSQFHAGHDYAILGATCDTAVAVIAFKGQETGNLRVGMPGTTDTLDISTYFVDLSEKYGTPHIPVFNADNKGSFYVSTLANTASVAAKVYVTAAELMHTITP